MMQKIDLKNKPDKLLKSEHGLPRMSDLAMGIMEGMRLFAQAAEAIFSKRAEEVKDEVSEQVEGAV